MSNKDLWLAWIAQNPINLYMERADTNTQAVASRLLVSRQMVYRWLAGESIPSAVRLKSLEDAGIATSKDYARWWDANPLPTRKRSRSAIDRDRVRELLDQKSEIDPNTGCKIYCGVWVKNKGTGIIRIGRRTYTVQKAALWVAGKIELYDRAHVYHTCRSPACCNLAHIAVAPNRSEGMRDKLANGIIKLRKNRGIYLTERRRDAVRILLDEGRTPAQISADTGVAEHLISRIVQQGGA